MNDWTTMALAELISERLSWARTHSKRRTAEGCCVVQLAAEG